MIHGLHELRIRQATLDESETGGKRSSKKRHRLAQRYGESAESALDFAWFTELFTAVVPSDDRI